MQLKDILIDAIYSQKLLTEWLDENPSWKEAEVLSNKIDWKEFCSQYGCLFFIYYGWIIKRKNKEYYFFIYEKRRPVNDLGILKKRRYKDGEKPIRRKRKYEEYSAKRTSSIVKRENVSYDNDCQIWAFASLLNISYEESYECLYSVGWRENSTYNTEGRWKKLLNTMGFRFERFWVRWYEKKGYTLKNIFEIVPKNGRFLINIRGHVLSVVDGVIYDNAGSSPYCRIIQVFEIKK